MCPSDLYVYAVLVCCVGILSVLLFTLVIAWQSVFHKRKSRGKKSDKVMSGMGSHPPTHTQAEDGGQSITLVGRHPGSVIVCLESESKVSEKACLSQVLLKYTDRRHTS